MRNKRGWLPSMVVVAVFLAACGGDSTETDTAAPESAGTAASDEDGTETDATAPESAGTEASDGADVCTEDRRGGTVTMGMFSPTRGLDPTVALGSGTAGGTELAALYDTLLRYDPATGEYAPHVAESLTPNDDLTEWTLRLRPGIRFGNGDPLTTEAVRFSLERMKAAPVASAGTVAEITEMEIVDDLTMVFKLAESWGGFPYVLAEDAGNIVNPAVVDAMGAEEFNLYPHGAGVGPFEIERFAVGEEIVLRAKDDYWGGPVCIDTLRFVFVPGSRATYDAFRAGELEIAFLREAPVVADAKAAGVTGYSNVGGAGRVLLVNNGGETTTPPTSDVRVRQAVVLALDLDVLNERIEDGVGLPTSALIPEQSRLYDGLDGPPFDPDRARELVSEAKAAGWNGEMRFLCGNTPSSIALSIAVEAMLEAVGMTVTLENLTYADLSRRTILDRDYDIACGGMSIFDSSPIARLNQFQSVSPRNGVGYANTEMDAALEALALAATEDDTMAALEDIQRIWNETIPSASLFAVEEFVASVPDVRGLVYSRDTTVMFHDAYVTS